MTTIEGYNASVLTQLVSETNSSDIYGLKNSLINNKQLLDESTDVLNNIGTDVESMARLDKEQQQLEATRSTMLSNKTDIIAKKTELLKQGVSIDGKNINTETWIQNHPFEMWNYANKINKIEVHYTSFGIMGIKISYRDQNKAPEIIGVVTNTNGSSPTTIETVNFTDDEWLVQVQIEVSSDSIASVLCKNISFYTSKNAQGTPPKITIPPSSPNNIMKSKIYYIDGTRRTWLQHKSNAETQGATLACFENSQEINLMLMELGQDRYKYGSFYIGLYHTNALIPNNNSGGGKRNNVPSNKNSSWEWVDGTPYNPISTNWNGGEPNNWGPGENVGQMYSNGKINDLTKTNLLAAIYQKKINNRTEQTPREPGQHITYFSMVPPGKVTYDSITSPDIVQKTNAQSAVESTKQVTSQIQETANTLDMSIKDIDEAIAKITTNIDHIKNKRKLVNKLNEIGEKSLETNLTDGFANIGDLFSKYIPNMPIREPIREGLTPEQQAANLGFINAINRTNLNVLNATNDILPQIDTLEAKETANAISEFIIKKDNIFTNVLTDYMLNDGKKNNFKDVYSKIDQQNAEKMRQIEINTYYDKAYKEYTDILKVIIFACIILVPIVIANKKFLLPNNVTNIMVVVIIFLTIIYTIYKLIDIHMRDNKDFDKIQIPYDREAAVLEKSGKITRKKNLLSTFANTCIGQDCCPDTSFGLIFDPVVNRCVVKDRFSNYFDGQVSDYLGETFNGYFNGLVGKSNLTNSYSMVQPFVTIGQLAQESLNNSSQDKFLK